MAAKRCKNRKCRKPLTQVGERCRGTCNICDLLGSHKPPGGDQSAGWPRKSLALMVHPSQAKEFTEDAKHMGVPTYFDPKDGKPVFTNAGHQKAYEKAYGYFNKDSCV